MKKLDLKTPIIYLLMIIIVILLIILKKMDEKVSGVDEEILKKEKIEITDQEKSIIVKEPLVDEKIEAPFKGRIAIVIDDFGYRNDEISDGFLKIDADLTYAIIPGHNYSTSFGAKAVPCVDVTVSVGAPIT